MFKKIIDVNIFNEYYDDPPDVAIIEMTDETLKDILSLKGLFKKHNLDVVSRYDYTPKMMNKVIDENYEQLEDLEEARGSYDCMMLNIRGQDIYWGFSVKNTDINGETDTICLEEIEEYLKVKEMPLEDLPQLINHENELIKNLVNERLSNGLAPD